MTLKHNNIYLSKNEIEILRNLLVNQKNLKDNWSDEERKLHEKLFKIFNKP